MVAKKSRNMKTIKIILLTSALFLAFAIGMFVQYKYGGANIFELQCKQ